MDMDLNNRLTEDETLEQAYDIFLELAADNLDPADVLLFNDVFARILLCREKDHKLCHIIWRE